MYNSIIAEIILSNHYNHFHYIHDGISTLDFIERYCKNKMIQIKV
jgi:hypothetical protein